MQPGREIYSYGAKFGAMGWISGLTIGIGFALFAFLTFEICRIYKVYDYKNYIKQVIGPLWPMMDILTVLIAILLIAVMAPQLEVFSSRSDFRIFSAPL